jgi:carbonic anhydrase
MADRRHVARRALERLLEGNARFVQHLISVEILSGHLDRDKLVHGQRPIAAILGCSDSRAPAELVFNQGLGDLFVIRVAGNVVAPSLVGSVEYAVSQLDVPLVVVMGHTHCGAVQATIHALRSPGGQVTANIRDIVQRIRPAVEGLLARAPASEPALLDAAIRANVLRAAQQLQHGSPLLEAMVQEGQATVVPALYRLESGQVEILASGA